MKKFLTVCLLLCMGVIFTACGKKEIEISYNDIKDNKEIIVDDEKVTITLEGNPTTGYIWERTNVENEENLNVLVDTYVSSQQGVPEDQIRLGAGGKYISEFSLKENGTCMVELTYHRTFEEGFAKKVVYEITKQDDELTCIKVSEEE